MLATGPARAASDGRDGPDRSSDRVDRRAGRADAQVRVVRDILADQRQRDHPQLVVTDGGHLRVGMEDTITYQKGQPVESNAQLVARASAFARLAGRPPMSPADARTFLGIRPRD